ncbi:MAG: glycine-rich domain-containing protein, partial [Candidatus Omnitrophota bacterium]
MSKNLAIGPVSSIPITATGGTITEVGGYRIHTFTTSGTFQITAGNGNVDVLVVAAGGGGGGSASIDIAGGGGAGGLIYNNAHNISVGTFPVTVGVGGVGGVGFAAGTNGGNSSF